MRMFLLDSEQRLPVDYISYNVAEWLSEASVLHPYRNAFKFVLDGDPIPEKTAEVFQQVVQRDAAWQIAFDQSFEWEVWPIVDRMRERNRNLCFQTEAFPKLLENLGKSDSVMRCNFDHGHLWDVQTLVEEHEDWIPIEWLQNWQRPNEGVDTCPPLPSWSKLLDDNLTDKYLEYLANGDSELDSLFDSEESEEEGEGGDDGNDRVDWGGLEQDHGDDEARSENAEDGS